MSFIDFIETDLKALADYPFLSNALSSATRIVSNASTRSCGEILPVVIFSFALASVACDSFASTSETETVEEQQQSRPERNVLEKYARVIRGMFGVLHLINGAKLAEAGKIEDLDERKSVEMGAKWLSDCYASTLKKVILTTKTRSILSEPAYRECLVGKMASSSKGALGFNLPEDEPNEERDKVIGERATKQIAQLMTCVVECFDISFLATDFAERKSS